mmetsp:Transcript_45180/g.109340  ORF Transcript_45180/g.109340 Transcript_45180/m.109340 type:complete len:235 (-) Transcript_45180:35-739(-)
MEDRKKEPHPSTLQYQIVKNKSLQSEYCYRQSVLHNPKIYSLLQQRHSLNKTRKMNSLLATIRSCLLFATLTVVVQAYKIGDTVDGIVWTGQEFNAMKRAEMPVFGQSSIATFERKGLLSFGFEDGLHMLPWIDTKDFESVTITFVFSKIGQGAIESVSINISRGTSASDDIVVEYQWVEEIPASPQEGTVAMLLGSLISCVAVLFHVCATSDSEEKPTEVNTNTTRQLRGHED